jgi:ABC-2 type transport system ATP-binding protein
MIKLTNLVAGYKQKNPVLSAISTQIEAGNIYGLLGSNGVGKTTLLHTIAGVLEPLSGEVDVMGHTPSAHTRQFFEQIYYITDEVELPAMSLEGYIGTYAKFRPGFSREQMQDYLQRMNFTFGVRLNKLSLGNRKKFVIAYALACNTPLLLMDEPTNGLDIESKRQLRSILASLDMSNRAIIISTHQIADLEQMLSHILIIKDKQLIISTSLDNVAQRLSFGRVGEFAEPLFVDGLRVIAQNNGEYSNLDLEMLYLAVLESAEVRAIINQPQMATESGKESLC